MIYRAWQCLYVALSHKLSHVVHEFSVNVPFSFVILHGFKIRCLILSLDIGRISGSSCGWSTTTCHIVNV